MWFMWIFTCERFVYNQIKLAKSKYYQDAVNYNKDNPSDLWKTLNELISRNVSSQSPSCIISEDEPATDKKFSNNLKQLL